MVIVGLTGGIASGKSTVANFFKELGAYLIDWDVLSREAIQPHLKAWEEIINYFGTEVLNKDMTLNRQRLGQIVFANPKKLKELNQIVHPEVIKEDKRRVAEIRELDPEAIVIKDVPLLIETGNQRYVDKVVVVYAGRENQIKRLLKLGFTPDKARKRIESQLSLDEKVKFADFVIYNDGSLKETRRQVEEVYKALSTTQHLSGKEEGNLGENRYEHDDHKY